MRGSQDVPQTTIGNESGLGRPSTSGSALSTPFRLEDLSENDINAILKQFFASINHYLPIFINQGRLHNRLAKRTASSVESACASAIVACVALYNGSFEVSEQAIQHALSMVDWKFLSEQSLFALQTVLMIIVGLRSLRVHYELANNLLAVAIRRVYSIRLHRLNEVTDISLEDRLEGLQIYWSVFILDKETSIRNHTPPGMPDDEVDVLGIEPPRRPQLRSGLVQSLDGSTGLSLYTARQRLARIGGRVWKDLYTARARAQPSNLQKEVIKASNEQLRRWKEEWLDLAGDLQQHWPKIGIDHVIDLQLTYLEFMIRANPGVLTSVVDVVDALQRNEDLVEPSSICLDAARDVLRMVRFRETSRYEQIL